uniref:Uncharacterized protein n=1 Tax=Rhizophora mucronata TaxID=61149 RepID=A0A2P2N9W8_RHIMU
MVVRTVENGSQENGKKRVYRNKVGGERRER